MPEGLERKYTRFVYLCKMKLLKRQKCLIEVIDLNRAYTQFILDDATCLLVIADCSVSQAFQDSIN